MSFSEALSSFSFLQNALLGGVLASIACGLMGPFVVVRRMSQLVGGISHSVLGGMGVAYFFSISPWIGALTAAVLAAFLLGWAVSSRSGRRASDTQLDIWVSAIWAFGMAVGILFISQVPTYTTDLMTFLFGNVLMISSQDLWIMLLQNLVIGFTLLATFKSLVAVSFDEEFAFLRGLKPAFYHALFLILVSLTVVLLVRVVGLILVIALLTLPAASALRFRQLSLKGAIWVSMGLGVLYSSVGIFASYQTNLPSGAMIVVLATLGYGISGLKRN